MKKCAHIDKNGIRCQEPVLSRSVRTSGSVRASVGTKGEFIWIYPDREPASKFCYYHNNALLADQHQHSINIKKGIISHIEKANIIKGY